MTLAIIAGSGALPARIEEACQEQGRSYFVLAIEGAANPADFKEATPMRLGAIGKTFALMKERGATEIVFAGRVERPKLSNLRPDLKAAKLIARLGPNLFAGDDSVLRTVITFCEEEGFRVLGVEDVATNLLAPNGPLGKHMPSERDEADIAIGLDAARALGKLDIGQSVIVQNKQVLGVEAAEGTDALIRRCAALKQEGPGGVLVKIAKPGQDRRADLPTIGPTTLEAVHQGGFAGIAVEAESTLLLERALLRERADDLGLFVVGIR